MLVLSGRTRMAGLLETALMGARELADDFVGARNKKSGDEGRVVGSMH